MNRLTGEIADLVEKTHLKDKNRLLGQ